MGLGLAQIWLCAPTLRNLTPPDNRHTPQAARPTRIMKIAVIGGGSTYTPELVNGFIERLKTLPVTELWLMDIDAKRLAVVGGFAQRMLQAEGSPFKVVLSTDQRAAVRDAAYVTTQLLTRTDHIST